ncbi:Receptor-like serine/threonine-protein kinase NCRK [Striga hermonthica]|uniref:non-specific serine/threonine protein kinase n=1 Tax=Striga hermonthica TaxID=68872 RepID=A0A9N7MU05_STRHE|nr:Receptor-like serine/threonine-protein kinase NCRK [Striga hermonthica]
MRLLVEIALFCILNAVLIQQVFCDGVSTKSETNKWTCSCSVSYQANLKFTPANCSSSCDCSPAVGGSRGDKWTCFCSNGGFPRLVGDDEGSSCFTACDCNAGTLSELEPPKKWVSSKVVVIVLLLCLVLMALALVASVLWFVHWKDKHRIQWSSSSSDKLTSFSSATNLTSRGSSSLLVYKEYLDSSVKPYLGCIPRISFLLRTRQGAIQGTITQFSYFELESATNRFSDDNLVGVGGSSHVYRGTLRDGRTVAIKRMKTQAGPDAEHAFLSEIDLISRIHHCHVVPLYGYCSVNQGKHAERLLVFEYIPNGNLRKCLDGDLGECLEWSTRVSVALGAARGLEYLHEAAAPRILHRDVKSTNILLDEKWRAKITDLGMAKHLHSDDFTSCSSSPARMQGTFGYFAPEYAIVGQASLKSDVFSFGVVLLELITGRKPIYKSSNKTEESLVIWATPRLHDSKRVIMELPDPRLKGAFQEEEMQVMAYLAKECLLLDPDSRPSMSEVVQILSTIAPHKSQRKNLSLGAFQYSSTCAMESRKPETCEAVSSREEIKQIMFESTKNSEDDYSNDVEKLMLLTSKTRSWRLRDDEVVVDLTEPRFESFCLPNVDPT